MLVRLVQIRGGKPNRFVFTNMWLDARMAIKVEHLPAEARFEVTGDHVTLRPTEGDIAVNAEPVHDPRPLAHGDLVALKGWHDEVFYEFEEDLRLAKVTRWQSEAALGIQRPAPDMTTVGLGGDDAFSVDETAITITEKGHSKVLPWEELDAVKFTPQGEYHQTSGDLLSEIEAGVSAGSKAASYGSEDVAESDVDPTFHARAYQVGFQRRVKVLALMVTDSATCRRLAEAIEYYAPTDLTWFGTVGGLVVTPVPLAALATQTMPDVPDVEAAPWRRPYRFSGRLPLRALALMVGAGVPAALIAGALGYLGGAITGWIGTQVVHLGTAVASWVTGLHLLGNAASLAMGAIAGVTVAALPVLLVGFLYPILIGWAAGSSVAWGAKAGKCRKPEAAGLLGLLAGGLAYIALVGTTLLMNTPLHESSRVLEVVDPPISYGLMVIDGLLVLYFARRTAVSESSETPYCESCQTWYVTSTTTSIPIEGAAPLVEAVASGSMRPLQTVPVEITDPERIQLDLSRCECGQSDYNLVATVHWDERKKGSTNTASKTRAWFSTTLPAALGAAMGLWGIAKPRRPAAAWHTAARPIVPPTPSVLPSTTPMPITAPTSRFPPPPGPASARSSTAPATAFGRRCGRRVRRRPEGHPGGS